MTQAQQDAVIAAQMKFFGAEKAANTAQSQYDGENAAFVQAKNDALYGVPAQAQAMIKTAQDKYLALMNDLPAKSAVAEAAWAAVGQAQMEYNAAIQASLLQGGAEKP